MVLFVTMFGCAPSPAARWEVTTTFGPPLRASSVELTDDSTLHVLATTGTQIHIPIISVEKIRWRSTAALDWGGAVGGILGGLAGCAIGRSDAQTNSPNAVDGLGRLLRGTVGGVFVGGALGGLTGAAIGSDDVCTVSTLSADTRVETVAKFIERHR